MPDSLSYVDAAALPHAGNLAYQSLFDVADLKPEHRLLVNGAGGGVGPLVAQLAAHHGVRDIVGVDSASKQDFMREAGFARTLDYREVDFTRTGERFDVIVDTRLTRSPFSLPRALDARRRLRRRRCDDAETARAGHLRSARRAARPASRCGCSLLKSNKNTAEIAALAEAGVLTPRIDSVVPLDDTAQALARFGAAEHRGKIVVGVV